MNTAARVRSSCGRNDEEGEQRCMAVQAHGRSPAEGARLTGHDTAHGAGRNASASGHYSCDSTSSLVPTLPSTTAALRFIARSFGRFIGEPRKPLRYPSMSHHTAQDAPSLSVRGGR